MAEPSAVVFAAPHRPDPAVRLDRQAETIWVAALGGLATALYLLTRSAWSVPDALAYARLARDNALLAPSFFAPEHLLYPFLPWSLLAALRGAGLAPDALTTLQLVNAMGAGAGIGALFVLARVVTRHQVARRWCAAVALAVAVSYGYWHHATQAENQVLAIAVLIAALCPLASLFQDPRRPQERAAVAGVLLAAAILLHATLVLALPGFAIAGALATRRWRTPAVTLAACGLVIATLYAIVGVLILGFTSPDAWANWLLSGRGGGVWGQFRVANLPQGVRSFVEAVVYLGPGFDLGQLRSAPGDVLNAARLAMSLLVSGVLLAGAIGAVLAARRTRLLGPVLMLLLLVLTFDGFALWWAPDDVQFWIVGWTMLALLTMLAAIGASRWTAARRMLPWVTGGLIGFVFAINLAGVFAPQTRAEDNPGLQAALCLAPRLDARDLVVSPGWGWSGTYLPYLLPAGGARTFSLLDVYLGPARRDRGRLFGALDADIRATMARGGSVYIAELYDLNAEERAYLARALDGLAPELIDLPRREVASCGGRPIWQLDLEAAA